MALTLASACTASAQSWVQVNAPLENWVTPAYSTNGDRIVAAAWNGGIYVSTNYGFDWTLTTAPSTNSWSSVACSADGNQILAAVLDGPIYVSRDAGLTWRQSSAPTGHWSSVACSSDATKILAAQGDSGTLGFLYLSTNSGATWSIADSLYHGWAQVAMSFDGTLMFANGASLNLSTNSGATWDSLGQSVGDFAVSGDGQRVMGLGPVLAPTQWLYVSTNSGVSGSFFDLPYILFGSIASSGDGMNVVASETCAPAYTSSDGGNNWTLATNVDASSTLVLAASPSGACLLAMEPFGGSWISYVGDSPPFFVQQPPATTVAIQTTSVTLETKLLGSDPMELQWQCNGTNLVDDGRVSGSTTGTLTISNLQVSDSGTYILLATNRFGSVTSQPASLAVNPDLQSPTLVVMDPSAGQNIGWGFQVDGFASDDGRLAGVWFQLNSGPWYLTESSDFWQSWWSPLFPVPGTNVLRCYAMDAAGNYSPTNTLNFTATIVSQLVLLLNGPGVTKPNAYSNGCFLEVGSNYVITAKTPPGYIFAGWSGGIQSAKEKLSFTMQTNLLLQASFVPNPFPPISGRYSGIVSVSKGYPAFPPISFTAVVGRKGAFEAILRLAKQVYHCSGQFSPTGLAGVSFTSKGVDPLAGSLQLDFSGGLRGELSAFGIIAEIGATRVVERPEN